MRLNRLKRTLSLLLALAAVLSLTVLPGHASRFSDVTDEQVAVAADTLSALGVVSGTGAGKFSPNGYLTRAQLCKMAIEIMGMGEQAQAQAYRTIFIDMKNHWASGYVNLAAITEVPEGSGTRLMLGLGNGRFGPDRNITYQEAATLALRILGYGAEANRAWPHSAIQTAAQLGLDRDLGIKNPAAAITRGQTALLFYHLLSTPVKGSQEPFALQLGTPMDDTILLANDATVNGHSGWVVLAHGDSTESYPAAGQVDSSLLGKRGWALLDKEGRFVTLVPDESICVTASVERKEGYYLYLNGQRYTLSENTTVYTGSARDGRVTTYGEYMANLRAGATVTLYLDEKGTVLGLYRAEATPETRFLVAGKSVSQETFRSLTGSEQNYTIRKNGASIAMSAIKQYDVVTYDPVAKVLDVCDVRLTCVYENASPSPSSPSWITAAGGNRFDVMADAIRAFSDRKIGDSITLLLTSSGRVAGLLPKTGGSTPAASSAFGVITEDGFHFQLLGCDLTLKLSGAAPSEAMKGQILNASSAQRGTLTLTTAGTQSSIQFDTVNMTLGNMKVSPGVQVYERTSSGLLARSLSELPASVTAAQYHREGTGPVDLIILYDYSGEGYKYGRIDVVTEYMLKKEGTTWELKTKQGRLEFSGEEDDTCTPPDGSIHASGYGAIVKYDGIFSGVIYLQAIPNVRSSDFYTENGVTYVRTSKGTYPVDAKVQCFNEAASYNTAPDWVQEVLRNGGVWRDENLPSGAVGDTWVSGGVKPQKFSSLGECRSFSDTVTVYIDSRLQRVRVVVAGT